MLEAEQIFEKRVAFGKKRYYTSYLLAIRETKLFLRQIKG